LPPLAREIFVKLIFDLFENRIILDPIILWVNNPLSFWKANHLKDAALASQQKPPDGRCYMPVVKNRSL